LGAICCFNVIEPKSRRFEQISYYFITKNLFCKQIRHNPHRPDTISILYSADFFTA